MNVLSLFDGMSCGQQALERAGIKVDKYFASEIDKYAIQVTMANYPDSIQLGSVINVDGYSLPKIDLLIGGSPCQSFSFAGKRKGMSTKDEQEILTLEHYLQLKSEGFEFEGQSYLFWEYMRLLNEVKPTYFLLENVMMGKKWEKVLSEAIGVNGIHINSSLVSAQNRKRIYWTNISMESSGLFGEMKSIIKQPVDKGILLKDILEKDVDEKYFVSDKMKSWLDRHALKRQVNVKELDGNQKSSCLTATAQVKGNLSTDYICHNTMPRSLTTGKGGTGPLSRNDGKTYCLDTGQTNAIEILGCDYRTDEGIRIRENGKSGTLAARARNDESCGQLAKINSLIRKLTPIECERLQTVKDNYTEFCISIDYLYICKETNVIKKWLQNAELKSAIQILQIKKQVYATNIIYDLSELEQLKERLLIEQENASTKNATILNKLLKDIVLLTTKDLSNTAHQNYLLKLFKEIENVNIAIKPLEKMEEGLEECVIDITKTFIDTTTLYMQIINAMKLSQGGTMVELMVKSDIGLLWKIQSEKTLNLAKLYITLILIKQIIQSKIYTYSKIKMNIKSLISNLNILDQNCLSVELLDLRMENISLNSDSQRYKMLGNGWTIDVIVHILNYIK